MDADPFYFWSGYQDDKNNKLFFSLMLSIDT